MVPKQTKDKILTSVEFMQTLRKTLTNGGVEEVAKKFATLRDHSFYLPTDLRHGSFFVDHEHIKVMGSISNPISIPTLKHRSETPGAPNDQDNMFEIAGSIVGCNTNTKTPKCLFKPVDIRKEMYATPLLIN